MRTLLKIKESKPYSNHTLDIKIGSVSCALKCQDTVIYDKLQRLYHDFLTEEPADVTIELKPVNRLSPEDLSTILSRTRFKHKGNSIRTTSRIMRGRYNLARHTISITGEGSLIDPDMEFNHLNKLLTAAYYSACKIKYDSRPPAMLVHACGILRYGQALVFTGPSEAGKSTIARLFDKQHGEVINDEMLLTSRPSPAGNSVSIQSAPIIGDLLPGRNTAAPLRCILLLKQSHKTAFHYLDKVDAHLRFMRQIISPVCIGQKDKRSVYSMIADFSAEVTSAVPVYEFEFNLDEKSLWQITGDL